MARHRRRAARPPAYRPAPGYPQHQSTATYYQRPDVSYVQLHDIPPTDVALAYPSARRSPLITEFTAIATALSGLPITGDPGGRGLDTMRYSRLLSTSDVKCMLAFYAL